MWTPLPFAKRFNNAQKDPEIMPLQKSFDFAVTAEMACVMCHFSSECGGCCNKCRAAGTECGSQQLCSQPSRRYDADRWASWIAIVRSNPAFNNLKRYIPKEWRKSLKIR